MSTVIIDGKEISFTGGQTILEICHKAGFYIPTLCHDDKLEPTGVCNICCVEIIGFGLVASCATRAADGMVIETNSPRVRTARKQVLETLLADHYGDCISPCQNRCPAGIDIQSYLNQIARGDYSGAVRTIKDRLPLPGVIGRVCPHPCEEACRRNLVDEPVAICSLKRFAADRVAIAEDGFLPVTKPESGHKVAVVGAGPAGLSAAYYLNLEGHKVTIFEALPKPGGMLRYGIPAYRLPKNILDDEINTITKMGTVIKTGMALGKDYTVESLREDGFSAVFIAIGAHQSQTLGIEREELQGVFPGTDFLRNFTLGKTIELGQQVAVIGGGNTAIDAARTAIRMGAREITMVYRRSRAEMPASDWEIEEAEEEGVKLLFLAAPVKVLGTDGRVTGLECIKMALGEPDSSGRRRPVPVKGSEFTLSVDSIIAAIGQRPDLSSLSKDSDIRTDKANIVASSDTMETSVPGVFAGGDCVTGAATAVEAIAGGRRAAMAINRFLNGEPLNPPRKPFNISRGELNDLKGKNEFPLFEKTARARMPKYNVSQRVTDFREIEHGFTVESARQEAARCLECGCRANWYCTLRELASEYGIADVKAKLDRPYYPMDKSHPFVERDSNKCISCERCARTCLDVQGLGAITINYRVGTTEGYGGSLLNTICVSCGQCIAACPVGALSSKVDVQPEYEVLSTCPYCGVGCQIYLGIKNNKIVSTRGDIENETNQGRLCVKGRFGIPEFVHSNERLAEPLIKKDGKFVRSSWDEALDLVSTKLREYHGKTAAIASAKCTNEDNYVFQKFTRAVLGTNNLDHCARL